MFMSVSATTVWPVVGVQGSRDLVPGERGLDGDARVSPGRGSRRP